MKISKKRIHEIIKEEMNHLSEQDQLDLTKFEPAVKNAVSQIVNASNNDKNLAIMLAQQVLARINEAA